MINEVDIMEFNDKSVGLILSILNPSRYYEIKNLYEQLVADNTKEYKIEQIEYTCSNSANNITIKEDNKINQKQDFYINYNSFVNEEQIANAIVSSINDDFFNQDIERLPRVIFYKNLFIFKSPDGKEKISLIKKQKNYGFDEADGTFYINNNDVTINKNNNVPFIKSMSYDLYNKKENSRIIYYKQNETNSEIILKKNSFVYMESKNSFPLKFDDKTDEPKKENIEDFSKLVRNMIRKSIKFCEIATKKGKEVNQIHILLFYDHIILNDERTKIVIDELQNNFTKAYFKLEKKTKFEVIFFVNPSTINITKFSRSIAKKIEEMEKKNNDKINKLEMKNKQIEDDNRLKIEEMEKKNNQIIEQLNKEKNENNDKINELEKKNKQIEDNNRLKMEEIEKKNKELLAQLIKEKNENNNKINELEKKNKQIEDKNKLQIEEIEKKNNQIIEQLSKENQEKMIGLENKFQGRDKEYNNKIADLEKLVINLQSQIQELQKKKNEKTGINNNQIVTKNEFNNNKNNSDDFISFINDKMKKKEEKIENIIDLKNGLICFLSNIKSYIIKNNSILKILNGKRDVILSLNNGNIISSKRSSIIFYEKDSFKIIKEIKIGCFAKQIIELKNCDILILSQYSELCLIKANTINVDKIILNKNLNILSIIEINNDKVAIISNNLDTKNIGINYFDLNTKILKQYLILEENNDINLKVDSFIINNNIFISFLNNLYIVDFISQKMEKKELGFSKFYSFNNNIFGIKEKSIYNITINNDIVNANKIYEDNSDNIICFIYSEDKKCIFCTINKVGSF